MEIDFKSMKKNVEKRGMGRREVGIIRGGNGKG